MIIDSLLQVSNNQTVTGGMTTVSANTVDVGTIDRALGTGRQLYLNVTINSIAGGDGSDVFRVDVVQSAAADLSSDSIIASTRTITGVANLAVGMKFSIPIPPAYVIAGRYLGAAFDAITADLVLGITAEFSDSPVPDHTSYNDATEGVTV